MEVQRRGVDPLLGDGADLAEGVVGDVGCLVNVGVHRTSAVCPEFRKDRPYQLKVSGLMKGGAALNGV